MRGAERGAAQDAGRPDSWRPRRGPALKWREGAGRGANPRFLANFATVYAPGRPLSPEGASAAARDLGKRGQPARRGPARGVNRGVFGQKPGSARRAGERARARAGSRTGVRDAGRPGTGAANGGRPRNSPAPHPIRQTRTGTPPPTKKAQHGIRRRLRRKNTGHPGANCPQGSGRGVHPRPSEAKRTRPGRSRNPSDRAAPGESGCPPSRRCGECATWPC